jgi:hypothetical protein
MSRVRDLALTADSQSLRRRVSSALLLFLAPVSLVIAIAGGTSASASTARIQGAFLAVPSISTFCGYAENVSKNNAASAISESPTSLKALYAKIKAEEPAILAASPSQIRGDFQVLFTYFNNFYGELATVGYNFLKLPHSYLATLESSASKVTAASKAIQAYLTKACGIKP